MYKNRMRYRNIDLVLVIVNYIFLTAILVIVLYPLIIVLSSSFSSPHAVMSGRVWLLPVEPTLSGYRAVFRNKQILTGYTNSFFYTFFGTLINLVMTIMAAYPLSRKDFYGGNLIMGIFTFTMLFSGGLIPTYLLVMKLGMVNSRLALLIPNAMSVWNVIIARTYFKSNIPNEMLEAAQLDGCTDIKFIFNIVLPLSTTIISVLVLFYAVGHWNSYFNAVVYIRDPKKYPLQIVLREILLLSQITDMIEDVRIASEYRNLHDLIKYSLIVIASAPILMLYPFVQKYFTSGIMVGSLKG